MSEIFSFMITFFVMIIVLGIPLMCGMLSLYLTFQLLLSVFGLIGDFVEAILEKFYKWKYHREIVKRNKKVWGDLWKK